MAIDTHSFAPSVSLVPEHWFFWLQSQFAKTATLTQEALNKELRNLPDRLLVDIGMDPREVVARAEDMTVTPYFAHVHPVTFRNSAKS